MLRKVYIEEFTNLLIVTWMEIDKTDIRYDEKKNRIIISFDDNEIEIPPYYIRDFLPTMKEEEKAKDLAMMIHDINREKLTRMTAFMSKSREIEKAILDTLSALSKCEKIVCIKRNDAIIRLHKQRMIVLAEIRRAVGLLNKEKQELRMRIANLGINPEDITGEEEKRR